MPHPLVSVVIIFWNEGPFIAQAIGSVLAQTYPEWELLLVDDGSSDEGTGTARDYADRYDRRVRYLTHPSHENRGTGPSRNLGLREAHGKYLFYLDGDDVIDPNTFAEQVDVLEANPSAAMVYGPIEWWYSWTGKPEDAGRDYVEQLGVGAERLIAPPKLLPRFLRDKAAVPSGFMVRSETARRVGGFDDKFHAEYEDQAFCAKICLAAPVYAAGRSWYRYRQHPDSLVATALSSGTTDASREFFLDWLDQYLRQQRVTSGEVWLSLWLERWRFSHPRLFHLLRRGERLFDRVAG